MAAPTDYPILSKFKLQWLADGQLVLSEDLADLFVEARSGYEWPAGVGSYESQKLILDIEESVQRSIRDLTPQKAKLIVEKVSKWAGNNQKAQQSICRADSEKQRLMLKAIERFENPDSPYWGLDTLSELPGLRLVISTKVYRFCCPDTGAAVDRHASYFFNSLYISDSRSNKRACTRFKREWSTGMHETSRLAIYQRHSHRKNLNEFIKAYVPTVRKIAEALNSQGIRYTCRATETQKRWRPCDIEMAAYYWWAQNGPR